MLLLIAARPSPLVVATSTTASQPLLPLPLPGLLLPLLLPGLLLPLLLPGLLLPLLLPGLLLPLLLLGLLLPPLLPGLLLPLLLPGMLPLRLQVHNACPEPLPVREALLRGGLRQHRPLPGCSGQ